MRGESFGQVVMAIMNSARATGTNRWMIWRSMT